MSQSKPPPQSSPHNTAVRQPTLGLSSTRTSGGNAPGSASAQDNGGPPKGKRPGMGGGHNQRRRNTVSDHRSTNGSLPSRSAIPLNDKQHLHSGGKCRTHPKGSVSARHLATLPSYSNSPLVAVPQSTSQSKTGNGKEERRHGQYPQQGFRSNPPRRQRRRSSQAVDIGNSDLLLTTASLGYYQQNQHRGGPSSSVKTPLTDAKNNRRHYAGAHFQNSPEPSALPVPAPFFQGTLTSPEVQHSTAVQGPENPTNGLIRALFGDNFQPPAVVEEVPLPENTINKSPAGAASQTHLRAKSRELFNLITGGPSLSPDPQSRHNRVPVPAPSTPGTTLPAPSTPSVIMSSDPVANLSGLFSKLQSSGTQQTLRNTKGSTTLSRSPSREQISSSSTTSHDVFGNHLDARTNFTKPKPSPSGAQSSRRTSSGMRRSKSQTSLHQAPSTPINGNSSRVSTKKPGEGSQRDKKPVYPASASKVHHRTPNGSTGYGKTNTSRSKVHSAKPSTSQSRKGSVTPHSNQTTKSNKIFSPTQILTNPNRRGTPESKLVAKTTSSHSLGKDQPRQLATEHQTSPPQAAGPLVTPIVILQREN
ncbi:hypothetical protein IWQ61_007908 [Dispira simplex]|nr:hypothetical protein IWQ61_007908 [Dispira simplex]